MLRSNRLGRFEPKLRIVRLSRALRAGCLRSTFPLRPFHLLALFLASGGEQIGKNSCGSGRGFKFTDDRRCGVLSGLKRLRIGTEATEEPFGLPACLALCSRVGEVVVDIALGDIVRRDQIDPIILAGG